MRRSLALCLILAASLAACGSEESSQSGSVTESVEEQLAYLDPESALVVAADLRYDGENWENLRGIVNRALAEARGLDLGDVPADAEELLNMLSSPNVGLSFDDDVRPLLDGHLVVGTAVDSGTDPFLREVPETHDLVVYRTRAGDLRPAVRKMLHGVPLRAWRGRDEVRVAETLAVVEEDTLIVADSVEALHAALERSDQGRGFPAELLGAAESGTGVDDPLLLATGALELMRFGGAWSENIERAVAEVPYFGAVERIDLAVDVSQDGVEARGEVVTTGAELSEDQLPLGPSGEVELPRAADGIAGGSLDQSRLTTFAATVVRSVFADSDFVAAVEETERELGIRFEDEVLRQFDCPSVSVFEPDPDAPLGAGGRFSARSCVRDPERMRELLPKLALHLPRLLRAMQGLGDVGLLGLLMLAPDAPLSPGALLLQAGVRELGGGAQDEQLYQASGLRESQSGETVFPGPDRVVFGMIGDDFVVGSDRQAARDAAKLETEPAGEEAASALRVPPDDLLVLLGGSEEAAAVAARTFGDLEVGFSADPLATRAHARMPLSD